MTKKLTTCLGFFAFAIFALVFGLFLSSTRPIVASAEVLQPAYVGVTDPDGLTIEYDPSRTFALISASLAQSGSVSTTTNGEDVGAMTEIFGKDPSYTGSAWCEFRRYENGSYGDFVDNSLVATVGTYEVTIHWTASYGEAWMTNEFEIVPRPIISKVEIKVFEEQMATFFLNSMFFYNSQIPYRQDGYDPVGYNSNFPDATFDLFWQCNNSGPETQQITGCYGYWTLKRIVSTNENYTLSDAVASETCTIEVIERTLRVTGETEITYNGHEQYPGFSVEYVKIAGEPDPTTDFHDLFEFISDEPFGFAPGLDAKNADYTCKLKLKDSASFYKIDGVDPYQINPCKEWNYRIVKANLTRAFADPSQSTYGDDGFSINDPDYEGQFEPEGAKPQPNTRLYFSAKNAVLADDSDEWIAVGIEHNLSEIVEAGVYQIKWDLIFQNYNTITARTTHTVLKKTLTPNLSGKTIAYGDQLPSFDGTYTGFVGSDTAESAIITPPTVSSSDYVRFSSPVGNYTLTVSGGEADNYAIEECSATLTVVQKTLTEFVTIKYFGVVMSCYHDPQAEVVNRLYYNPNGCSLDVAYPDYEDATFDLTWKKGTSGPSGSILGNDVDYYYLDSITCTNSNYSYEPSYMQKCTVNVQKRLIQIVGSTSCVYSGQFVYPTFDCSFATKPWEVFDAVSCSDVLMYADNMTPGKNVGSGYEASVCLKPAVVDYYGIMNIGATDDGYTWKYNITKATLSGEAPDLAYFYGDAVSFDQVTLSGYVDSVAPTPTTVRLYYSEKNAPTLSNYSADWINADVTPFATYPDVGSYQYKCILSFQNYKDITVRATCNVTQRTATFTFALGGVTKTGDALSAAAGGAGIGFLTSVTYNGAHQSPTVTFDNKLVGDDVEVYIQASNNKDVGVYECIVSALVGADACNYAFPTDIKLRACSYEITKADLSAEVQNVTATYGDVVCFAQPTIGGYLDSVAPTCTSSGFFYSARNAEPLAEDSSDWISGTVVPFVTLPDVGAYQYKYALSFQNYNDVIVRAVYTVLPKTIGIAFELDGTTKTSEELVAAAALAGTEYVLLTGVVYNGNDQTPVVVLNNVLDGDEVIPNVAASDFKNAGVCEYVVVSLSGADSSNYELPSEAALKKCYYEIEKTQITVRPTNKEVCYGGVSPEFEAGFSGFVAGEDQSVLSGAPAFSCAYGQGDDAGGYAIQASKGTLLAANYTFLFEEGTLSVTQKAVTVAFENTTQTYDGLVKTPTAVSFEGMLDGDELSVTYLDECVNAGNASLRFALSGADAQNYALTENTVLFTIEKKDLQFTVLVDGAIRENNEVTFNGQPHTVTATATNKCVGDDVSLAVEANEQTHAGSYASVVQIGGSKASNYQIADPAVTWTILPQKVKVYYNRSFGSTFTYGDAQAWAAIWENENKMNGSLYTYVTTDVLPGGGEALSEIFELGYNTKRDGSGSFVTADAFNAFNDAGIYWFCGGKRAEASDYDVTFLFDENAYVEIEKRELTVSWTLDGGVESCLVYDASCHTATPTVGNLVAGDVVDVFTEGDISSSDAGNYVARVLPGSYGENGNYIVRETTQNRSFAWEITPLAVTVTITPPANMVYDGAEKQVTVTYRDATDQEATISVSYNGGHTDAGEFSVFFTAPANYVITTYDNCGYAFDEVSGKFVSTPFAILPLTVSVTWTDLIAIYDGVDHKPIATINNKVVGDEVSVGFKAEAASVDAGAYAFATEDLVLLGSRAKNYSFKGDEAASMTIMKRHVSITVKEGETLGFAYGEPLVEKVYDALCYKEGSLEFVGDDTIQSVVRIRLINNGVVRQLDDMIPAGSHSVEISFAGENYSLDNSTDHFTLTVAQATLEVIAEDKETIYGNAAPAFTVRYSGFVGEDDASLLGGAPAFDCAYRAGDPVGSYVITPRGVTSNDYKIVFADGTLSVGQREIVVSNKNLVAPTYVYGDRTISQIDFYDLISVGEGALVGGDALKSVVGVSLCREGTAPIQSFATRRSAVGKYALQAYSLSDKYIVTTEFDDQAYLEIEKAVLTVTSVDKDAVYGDVVPEFAVTYEGFVEEEDATALEGELLFACEQNGSVGAYPIVPSGLSSENYDIRFVAGTLVVKKRSVTLAWQVTELVYNGAAQLPTVALGNLVEGDAVLPTIAGAAVNVGEYTAEVTGLSNENYAIPSENNTVTFVINKGDAGLDISGIVTEKNYTGSEVTFDGAVLTAIAGTDGITYENNKHTKVGTYTMKVKYAGSENYLADEKEVEIVILEAVPVVEVTSEGKKSVSLLKSVVEEDVKTSSGVGIGQAIRTVLDTAEREAADEVKLKIKVGESSTIVFDRAALNALSNAEDLKFTFETKREVDVGNKSLRNAELVFEISLEGASFAGGEATISTAYDKTIPFWQKGVVYYVDENGKKTDMKADFHNGTVTFTTGHFSTYIVEYKLADTVLSAIIIASAAVASGLIALIVISVLRRKKKQKMA